MDARSTLRCVPLSVAIDVVDLAEPRLLESSRCSAHALRLLLQDNLQEWSHLVDVGTSQISRKAQSSSR
jgi:hypothetical protein